MSTVLLLILWLTLNGVTPQSQPGPNVVFDLVITKAGSVVTVVGDSRNPQCAVDDTDPSCVHITLDVPAEEWRRVFPDWPNKPVQGEILKGKWDDGHFQSVASCAERTLRAKKAECKARYGEETSYDCARWRDDGFKPFDCLHTSPRSKFIAELLRSHADH